MYRMVLRRKVRKDDLDNQLIRTRDITLVDVFPKFTSQNVDVLDLWIRISDTVEGTTSRDLRIGYGTEIETQYHQGRSFIVKDIFQYIGWWTIRVTESFVLSP